MYIHTGQASSFFTTILVNAVSKTGLAPKNQLQVNLHQAHELFDLASYFFLERSWLHKL
jgi:hypothetical protein